MPDRKPTKAQSLSLDLLALYDNVSEFEASCAFFCDAVSALSTSSAGEWIDDSSAEGLRLYAQTLKEKSAVVKGEVEVAWKAASAMERH